ncbi:uncharacterized protein A1O9_10151 [Exophiala aquamarina CBS 119918]|uniref:Uncharacterized protein n=1 Tax=Exophiala aquamarina CBS 119918 TaxID=1182545 RepID=A0A072PDX1_9EURO|nr:uncharacterized protein A1O9_10151 [Exophiala aquamarina CBS 119918]KEF53750.1 hypothetical protein A1O9_10151 [Exophiala aquamarina CBS 119918]
MPFTLSRRNSSASKVSSRSDYDTVRFSNVSRMSNQHTPPRVPSLPPTAPVRSSSRPERGLPQSPRYDNGTGALDPQLIRDNQLPPHVKTARDLYEYQKLRHSQQVEQSGPSHSGQVSPVDSGSSYSERHSLALSYRPSQESSGRSIAQSFDIPRSLASRRPAATSFEIPRPQVHKTPRSANPMIRGLRNVYTIQAVSHILPGATQKNPYEGHYLLRGTLRDIPGEPAEKSGWWRKKNSKKEAASAPVRAINIETSGWYSD